MAQMRWSRASALLALAVLAALAARAPAQQKGAQFLGYPYCDALADPATKRYCMDYINSNAAEVKWTNAVFWARYRPGTFKCANITADCLLEDIKSGKFGSSCVVAPNGAPCEHEGGVGSCWQGLCGEPSEVAVNMLLARDGVPPSSLQLRELPSNMREAAPMPDYEYSDYEYNEDGEDGSAGGSSAGAAGGAGGAAAGAGFSQAGRGQSGSGAAAGGGGSGAAAGGSGGGAAAGGGSGANKGDGGGANKGGGGGTANGGSADDADDPYSYDYGDVTLPNNGNPPAPPPVDDPYGLGVALPPNPLVYKPFRPPSPSPPPPPPPPPSPPPPPPPRRQLTVDLQPDAFTGSVAASFIGVSREWTPAVWWDRNLKAYDNIFRELGPAPVLRIGGATQEALMRPPNSTFLNSLVTLHCVLGLRYIVGLPLFQNAPQLSLAVKRKFDEAFKDYPYAILSYELGNEPDYWPTRQGGFTTYKAQTVCVPVDYNNPAYELVGTIDTPTDKPGGVDGFAMYKEYQEPYVPYKASQYCYTPQATLFVEGTNNYLSYFRNAARAITGCGGLASATESQVLWGFPYWGPPGFNRQVISGPAWSEFQSGRFTLDNLVNFTGNSEGCYLGELTLHYYGPNANTTFEALFNKLTGDPTMPPGGLPGQPPPPTPVIQSVKSFADAARAANIPLRISESNSVPGGGQGNFSNTLGAALWTMVTAMEMARAGAVGMNLHWGSGGIPQDPSRAPAYVGVQTMFEDGDPNRPYPVPRVPWYGYVMFSRALGNNGPGLFLNYSSNQGLGPREAPTCNEYIYYYPVLVPHAGMISVAIANVHPNITCDFTVTLPGVVNTAATLQRLQGPKGLYSVANVTLAGQTYAGTTDGLMQGDFAPEVIQPHQETIRTTGWTFPVPPGSGALLQIPLSAGATNRVGDRSVTPWLTPGGGTQAAAPVSTAAWQEPKGVPGPALLPQPPPPQPPQPPPPQQQQQQQQPPLQQQQPWKTQGGGEKGASAAGNSPGKSAAGIGGAGAGGSAGGAAAGVDTRSNAAGQPGGGGGGGSSSGGGGSVSSGGGAPGPALPFPLSSRPLLGGGGGGGGLWSAPLPGTGSSPLPGAIVGATISLEPPPDGALGLQQGPDLGAGEYVLKSFGKDGRPVYTWKPSGGATYIGTGSGAGSYALGAAGAGSGAAAAGAGGGGAGGSDWVGVSSVGDASGAGLLGASLSKGAAAKPAAIGGLLGGLLGLGRRGRALLGAAAGAAPLPRRVRALLQLSSTPPHYQPAYPYVGPTTMQTAGQSAASQYSLPAVSGIGRVWPSGPANTSTLDVGQHGMGGYTLYPPGYDQAAVARAAQQCPGIARIMSVQAAAVNRRRHL